MSTDTYTDSFGNTVKITKIPYYLDRFPKKKSKRLRRALNKNKKKKSVQHIHKRKRKDTYINNNNPLMQEINYLDEEYIRILDSDD